MAKRQPQRAIDTPYTAPTSYARVAGGITELTIKYIDGGGADVTDDVLKGWTESEAYEFPSPTRDSDGIVTSGTVKWPDSSAGTFTATTTNTDWLAVDAFTITHTDSSKTVTQSAITRDDDTGYITTKPALTVA